MLTFGLLAVDDGSPWPARATMQAAGLGITGLDRDVREALRARQNRSTAPGLTAALLAWTSADPGLHETVATLERYTGSRRFYNLDVP